MGKLNSIAFFTYLGQFEVKLFMKNYTLLMFCSN